MRKVRGMQKKQNKKKNTQKKQQEQQENICSNINDLRWKQWIWPESFLPPPL